jgi:hypothetical protein
MALNGNPEIVAIHARLRAFACIMRKGDIIHRKRVSNIVRKIQKLAVGDGRSLFVWKR